MKEEPHPNKECSLNTMTNFDRDSNWLFVMH